MGGAAVSEHIDHFEISIDESHIVVKKVNEERFECFECFHLSIREGFIPGCIVGVTALSNCVGCATTRLSFMADHGR
mgnify:CR=1 FL=1